MKAIIIEDKDARALVDSLLLERLRVDNIMSMDAEKPSAWSDGAWRKKQIDDLHQSFHFVVVRWLQAQGCTLS